MRVTIQFDDEDGPEAAVDAINGLHYKSVVSEVAEVCRLVRRGEMFDKEALEEVEKLVFN